VHASLGGDDPRKSAVNPPSTALISTHSGENIIAADYTSCRRQPV